MTGSGQTASGPWCENASRAKPDMPEGDFVPEEENFG